MHSLRDSRRGLVWFDSNFFRDSSGPPKIDFASRFPPRQYEVKKHPILVGCRLSAHIQVSKKLISLPRFPPRQLETNKTKKRDNTNENKMIFTAFHNSSIIFISHIHNFNKPPILFLHICQNKNLSLWAYFLISMSLISYFSEFLIFLISYF